MKLTQEEKKLLLAVEEIKLKKQRELQWLQFKMFKNRKDYIRMETLTDELRLFKFLNNFDKMRALVEAQDN